MAKPKTRRLTRREEKQAHEEKCALQDVTHNACMMMTDMISVMTPHPMYEPTLHCGIGLQLFIGGMNLAPKMLPLKQVGYLQRRAVEYSLLGIQQIAAKHGIAVSYRVAPEGK